MSPEAWSLARQAVVEGELVVFPTDTVYGVACDPYNPAAIEKLFAAKGRVREKAIPLLLADAKYVRGVSSGLPATALRLGQAFWPGALTVVVPRRGDLPPNLSAATSANLSGQPDALTAEQAAAYLGKSVRVMVDGGTAPGGVPSTVVNCAVDPPVVLREGAIALDRILEALGDLR
jgi:tRNA A37 threonylcarbamoyladenosine synthetase subunit TsaC/SUA5/YrdC